MSSKAVTTRRTIKNVTASADAVECNTLEMARDVSYSKILPHTPEAGDPYYIGDAYQDPSLSISREWEINMADKPYLAHVKSLSAAWPPLRYLADFMEVSTTPLRWKFLRFNYGERLERSERTNVTVLDFPPSGRPMRTSFTNANKLREWLFKDRAIGVENSCTLLFLVEDLSREVIEILGAKFDLDPTFFREHIDDYSWYNARDRWMIPPSLTTAMRQRSWFQVRHVRARYFKTMESFQRAREESNIFNILRRPDDDQNNWAYLDEEGSVVGLSRTRTSIWIGKDGDKEGRTIGIILVDPTVKDGFPLWHGYCNWAPTPSMQCSNPPERPPRASLYEDLIHWTLTYPWFASTGYEDSSQDLQVLVKPILHIVCAEWLIMCEYIKTRLGQIEWELGFPNQFNSEGSVIDKSLKRLHTWRRVIPLYREMVSETLEHTLLLASNLSTLNQNATNTGSPSHMWGQTSGSRKPLDDIWCDFERILSAMQELQARTDRLTSVVTAAISIEESRRGLQESRNLARLTWLATIFIPMSFFTGLFSMQSNVGDLRYTFQWYFAAAVPFTALTLLFATRVRHRSLWKRTAKHGKMKGKSS